MIVAALVSVMGISIVAFVTNARMPVGSSDQRGEDAGPPPAEVTESDEVVIKGVARDFLRYAATGRPVEACLMVIDNGGILNPCEKDLSGRADYKALRRLDPELEVIGFDRKGDVATITGKQVRPAQAVKLSIEIVHTDRGEWKVRKMNGRPITFEGDF